MLTTQAHALFLAGLLFLPLAVRILQALLEGAKNSENATSAFAAGPTPLAHRVAASAAFVLLVVVVTAWLTRALDGAALNANDHRTALIALVAAMTAVAASVVVPLAAPTAYVVLSYLFPREDAVTKALMEIGTLSWIPTLSMVVVIAQARRREWHRLVPRSALGSVVILFAAWLGVSVVVAVVAGRPLSPDLIWRTTRYVQAITLFLVVAFWRPTLAQVRVITLVLISALAARQAWLTRAWLLEQNLAMVWVVSVPLALAVAFSRPITVSSLLLVPLSLYSAAMIVVVQNRGAVVGLAAALITLVLLARSRRLYLLLSLIPIAAAGVWALQAGLFHRFQEIYAGGRFLGTAAERLEIWQGGLEVARRHWFFGVGPGNFDSFLTQVHRRTIRDQCPQ